MREVRNDDAIDGAVGEHLLGRPHLLTERGKAAAVLDLGAGKRAGPQLGPDLLDQVRDVRPEPLVEVLTAELLVATLAREHEPVVGPLEHGGVERPAAEVVHRDVATGRDPSRGVVPRRGDGFLEQLDVVQAGACCRVPQRVGARRRPGRRVRQHDSIGGLLPGLAERLLHDRPSTAANTLGHLDLVPAEDDGFDDAEPAFRRPFDRLRPHRDQVLGLAPDDDLAVGIEDDHRGDPGHAVDEQRLGRAAVERDRSRGVRRAVVDRQGPAHSASADAAGCRRLPRRRPACQNCP